jgi:hypothetical protein
MESITSGRTRGVAQHLGALLGAELAQQFAQFGAAVGQDGNRQ